MKISKVVLYWPNSLSLILNSNCKISCKYVASTLNAISGHVELLILHYLSLCALEFVRSPSSWKQCVIVLCHSIIITTPLSGRGLATRTLNRPTKKSQADTTRGVDEGALIRAIHDIRVVDHYSDIILFFATPLTLTVRRDFADFQFR